MGLFWRGRSQCFRFCDPFRRLIKRGSMMPDLFAGVDFYQCSVQLRRDTVLQFSTAIDPRFFQQV